MYKKYIKRFFDIVVSLLLIVATSPILIVVSILILLEDKGDVFYIADRLGKNGQNYPMYKFRSMKVNAPDIRNEDGSTFNSKDDPRVTKVGKFIRRTSIDELPQLFNVLKGNMSLVGPRPDLPDQLTYYAEADKEKLLVLPGITGYNQAYYRNATEWRDRIKNDIYYVRNVSLLLDIKILFKTVDVVLFQRGIYIEQKNEDSN